MNALVKRIGNEIARDAQLALGEDEQAHAERHWPDRIERQVEAFKRLLERHKPVEQWGGGGHVERWLIAVECSYCWAFDRDGDRDDYGAGRAWPCDEIRDLAAIYGIEVD
jgi:hypothetical protein